MKNNTPELYPNMKGTTDTVQKTLQAQNLYAVGYANAQIDMENGNIPNLPLCKVGFEDYAPVSKVYTIGYLTAMKDEEKNPQKKAAIDATCATLTQAPQSYSLNIGEANMLLGLFASLYPQPVGKHKNTPQPIPYTGKENTGNG